MLLQQARYCTGISSHGMHALWCKKWQWFKQWVTDLTMLTSMIQTHNATWYGLRVSHATAPGNNLTGVAVQFATQDQQNAMQVQKCIATCYRLRVSHATAQSQQNVKKFQLCQCFQTSVIRSVFYTTWSRKCDRIKIVELWCCWNQSASIKINPESIFTPAHKLYDLNSIMLHYL